MVCSLVRFVLCASGLFGAVWASEQFNVSIGQVVYTVQREVSGTVVTYKAECNNTSKILTWWDPQGQELAGRWFKRFEAIYNERKKIQ